MIFRWQKQAARRSTSSCWGRFRSFRAATPGKNVICPIIYSSANVWISHQRCATDHQVLNHGLGLLESVIDPVGQVSRLLQEHGILSCDFENIYRDVLEPKSINEPETTYDSVCEQQTRHRNGSLHTDFWAEKIQFIMGMYWPGASDEMLIIRILGFNGSFFLSSSFPNRWMSVIHHDQLSWGSSHESVNTTDGTLTAQSLCQGTDGTRLF